MERARALRSTGVELAVVGAVQYLDTCSSYLLFVVTVTHIWLEGAMQSIKVKRPS